MAQKAAPEVVVVVTKSIARLSYWIGLLLVCWQIGSLKAGVLPADRSDALYHYYDGGGVTIQGPSILVRKSIADTVSISANYYVDNVSSASIDVVTTASQYTENRKEKSVGIDYLRGKTTMSLNYTQSDENDYAAKSVHFNISQDFFGDLTTLSIGYSQGWDVVGKRGEETFQEDTKRKNFRFGLTQILTKDSLLGFSWETVTDQGFLNNPYRSVRYLDPTVPLGYSYQPELYPNTHTSDAFALRGMYYLPYRASLKAEIKAYSDTWGVTAKTAELAYTHPWGEDWIFDVKIRKYTQDHADFFSDLFSRVDAQNFLARDKELSTFNSLAVGVGATYEYPLSDWEYLDKWTASLYWDHFLFKYDDFKDLRIQDVAPGEEPLYEYDANVIRLFFTIYY